MNDLKTLVLMLRHLNEILNAKQRKAFVATFCVILVGSTFELLGVTVMLPFIQVLLTPEVLMNKPIVRIILDLLNLTTADQALMLVGIGIILVYFIKNLFLLISSRVQIEYKCNLNKSLSVLMLKSYMDRPYEFFTNTNSGELLRGITSDVEGVCNVIELIFKFLSEALVVGLVAGYLIITDAIMAIGIMTIGIITMVIVVVGVKSNISRMGRIAERANADNYQNASQAIGGIKDIMTLGKRPYFLNKYEQSYDARRIATIHYQFVSAMPERIIEAFCISGIIATVLFKLRTGVNVEEFVPRMAVFAVAAFRLLPSISRITGYIATLIYYRPTLENAHENIVSAKECVSQAIPSNRINRIADTVNGLKDRVEIQNVSWKYSNAEKSVLQDLSLVINRGEAIGIVGESGAGKSTLSDILLQLYKPQTGSITVDGVDAKLLYDVWPAIIGYVPQSVFLLDATIRENVAFGEDRWDDDKVWDSLEKASLKEYVMSLPDGIDTMVGERGVKFSGGQRQRIAIARALYFDPSILVLDEATSALDNETESAVMEAVDSLHGKMTLVIIAHRLTTIRNCDRIYEIKNGKAYERRYEEIVK